VQPGIKFHNTFLFPIVCFPFLQVENHNNFLQSVFSNAKSSYHKYLSDHPTESHLTEFRHQDCIVPFNEADSKQQFLKLIISCSSYSDTQSTQMFDFDQLEQDVVTFYVSGKSLIKLDNVRTIFRFRNPPNGESTLRNRYIIIMYMISMIITAYIITEV